MGGACSTIDQKLADSAAAHAAGITSAAEAGVQAVSGVITGASDVFEQRVNKRLGAWTRCLIERP